MRLQNDSFDASAIFDGEIIFSLISRGREWRNLSARVVGISGQGLLVSSPKVLGESTHETVEGRHELVNVRTTLERAALGKGCNGQGKLEFNKLKPAGSHGYDVRRKTRHSGAGHST